MFERRVVQAGSSWRRAEATQSRRGCGDFRVEKHAEPSSGKKSLACGTSAARKERSHGRRARVLPGIDPVDRNPTDRGYDLARDPLVADAAAPVDIGATSELLASSSSPSSLSV